MFLIPRRVEGKVRWFVVQAWGDWTNVEFRTIHDLGEVPGDDRWHAVAAWRTALAADGTLRDALHEWECNSASLLVNDDVYDLHRRYGGGVSGAIDDDDDIDRRRAAHKRMTEAIPGTDRPTLLLFPGEGDPG